MNICPLYYSVFEQWSFIVQHLFNGVWGYAYYNLRSESGMFVKFLYELNWEFKLWGIVIINSLISIFISMFPKNIL